MDDRQLFETYKETVYLFCRYMVQSRADAEDLCQDVFFKAMIADRTNVQNTKAWLLRIAANECNTFLRRRQNGWAKELRSFMLGMPLRTPTVEETFEHREMVHTLHLLLDKLPKKTKLAFVLHYSAELSLPETAEVLNVPLGTVKSRINRGLKKMRKMLKEDPSGNWKGEETHAGAKG
ncbi:MULTISPECIES: RNA polymerase sigma factor [Paenibacillus]|uniref:RNA polymerase sigma factor n=2 Tax=Paenibacillus TaxID=44249 RepID=UPI0011A313C2|nr:RNA polymerase sigma factor [Paenibacillus sp. IHBB 10380]